MSTIDKVVAIISPRFPPVNGADMHRIRQSLPYYQKNGWQPIVIAVNAKYIEATQDELILQSIASVLFEYHEVKAFSTRWTRKLGLGSLGLRALVFYFFKVNSLLKKKQVDLIFFSTTEFPLAILGRYWKWRFGVPYLIDMQDPWHSEYYQDKPKSERPPKYWFSYRLNKYTESFAMQAVDGIIAVSQSYVDTLHKRYNHLLNVPYKVLTFGAAKEDFTFLDVYSVTQTRIVKNNHLFNVVYIGRGGHDMKKALSILFAGFAKGLSINPTLFKRIRFYFLGTSYAPQARAESTIYPIAETMGVADYVFEETSRIPYFESLQILKTADILVVPGSDDPAYTASKIFPYILAQKPLLTVFNQGSSVAEIISTCKAGICITFDNDNFNLEELAFSAYQALLIFTEQSPSPITTDWKAFQSYTAENLTKQQVNLFNIISSKEHE